MCAWIEILGIFFFFSSRLVVEQDFICKSRCFSSFFLINERIFSLERIDQKMSQDPNMYNAPYPPQQPGGYPPQQPGGYPPQQPGGYGQPQMPFQPPPVLPRPDYPKG